jgi:hypothetical protein
VVERRGYKLCLRGVVEERGYKPWLETKINLKSRLKDARNTIVSNP